MDRDAKQDMSRLLKLKEGATVATIPELDLAHAMAATCCLVNYLELLGDENNFGQFTLFPFDFSQVYLCHWPSCSTYGLLSS